LRHLCKSLRRPAFGEVGREASKRGRDWSREAGRLSEEAGKRSREVAVAGTVNARALSRDLSELGRELGELRITRRRQGPDWAPRVALLVGVGSGVAAMYFLDPEQGRRRRALLRDQWMKWTRVFGREATGVAKDVRNRAVGAVHETRRAVEGMTGTIGEQIDVEAPAVEETPDVADELEATDRQRSEVGL